MRSKVELLSLLCAAALAASAHTVTAQAPQQVVVRGSLGTPVQARTPDGDWDNLLQVFSDHALALYVQDVTDPSWVQSNYNSYEQGGSYTVTTVTQYRTPAACRQNQIEWGFADAAHIHACDFDIGYRLRTVRIEPLQHSISILWAAMVLNNGDLDPGSIQTHTYFLNTQRRQPGTSHALETLNALVARQMNNYTRRLNRTQ